MGSVGAILLAAFLLLFPEKVRQLFIPSLISYASGTLLGAAFLGLIPSAIEQISPSSALTTVLVGMVIFFILEKFILWHHCHEVSCEARQAMGPLLLIGDALHNFVDGVIIAATFVISVPMGIGTALAVTAHEVPQEVGDFAILLDSGYSKKRAFIYNLLSSLSTLPGAILAYVYLKDLHSVIPYVMALSAASFIYIATVDLIPRLHRQTTLWDSVRQLVLMLAGIGTIAIFHLSW
ncbi:MAG: ZIP family metal transporter [Proteobacteria bacterium]|nr:ZIP family metal transporter [Pseudomonadota bacterium]